VIQGHGAPGGRVSRLIGTQHAYSVELVQILENNRKTT
jgi:hypothetical protein